jgi:hypothetical protein
MDDDTPNTQAEPVPAAIVVSPACWLEVDKGWAELRLKRIDMEVIDFYREPA